MEDPFSQKLSRSKKTLVKSQVRSNPIVIDDNDDDGDEKLLQRPKAPSPKRVKIDSKSTKADSPRKRTEATKVDSPEKKTEATKMDSPKKRTKVTEVDSPKKKFSPKKLIEKGDNQAESPEKITVEIESKASPKKFNYREYLQRRSAGPAAPGSKPIPVGAPNCLLGLAFVFSGELDSLSREEAQDLVKRYGGRTTTAPSGRTSYVVLGREAGESKLKKIVELGLKTLDEDGLLELIRSSNPKGGHADAEARSSPSAIKETKQYSEEDIIQAKITKLVHKVPNVTVVKPETAKYEMWTDRYAPQTEDELIGNHSNYEKIVEWLQNWTPTVGEKAILISGPPGIGKTTAAHMACRQAGMDIVEMNASDTRSKSTLHDHVREIIDNRSLAGFDFFSKENQGGRKEHHFRKQALIMDEVDGMSAGDRGGMAELIQLLKRTKIPIICICNDRSSPKVRSLANYCLDLRFRRPDGRMVMPRIMAIAKKEGLELGINTVEELVASTQGDIRQILTLLSTYRLTSDSMNYDQSKFLGGGSKKDVDHGPFDAVPNLLGGTFDRMSLGEKIDQYFVDSSLVPLMVQENYLRAKSTTPRMIRGKATGHSYIDLCSAAADSISDADLVDSLIRGSNQEWSLSPFHAVMSSVRPAYYCHGAMSGRVEFASWLGQNSKQTKNWRLLGEITKHAYLKTATGKSEMRMSYAPVLAERLLRPLILEGVEGIDKTIELMDSYTLAREDVDSILDLVLDKRIGSEAYSKIPTTVKTTFTRRYNSGSHKLPYAIGGTAMAVKKITEVDMPAGGGGGDDDEELTLMADNGDEAEGEEDIGKDKMIKAKTVKGRGRGRGK